MKLNYCLSTATILLAFAAPGMAAQQSDEHKDHHPAPAAATPKPAPIVANSVKAGTAGDQMAGMDSQMKSMREMHDKMMKAKTPKERSALMADHMKVMQDGMNMMSKMSSQGMAGMDMKQGVPADGKKPTMEGMAEHHKMMEKRMEMMQAMMQMMMDRLSDPPVK